VGTLAKNMLALLGSQIASWAMALLMLIIVPKYLGDQQFGQFNFAVSFVAFFGLFAGLGGGQFIVKETARNNSLLGLYVFNALVMGLALAAVLSGAAIGLAHFLDYPSETCLVVALVCIGMTITTVNTTLYSGLQGLQRMTRPAIWVVLDRYIGGVAVFAALVARRGLIGVAVATSLYGWASLLGNGSRLFRPVWNNARLDLRVWRLLAVGGMPFLFWNLVLAIYGSIDIVMLSKLAGDAVVGWYALAYRLVGMPIFLATIVTTALLPELSAQSRRMSPDFAALVNRSVRLVFFASAPMTVGVALVAGDLIAFLHYPTRFAHSVPLIQILALHIPVVGITMVLGTALMACDRQKQWVAVGVIASVFNPVLNFIAIPATTRAFGNGAVGASVITVATELLMLGGALFLMHPHGVLDRRTQSFLGRCTLACAVMASLVFVTGGIWLPIRIIVGIVTYAIVSLLLGTLSANELRRRFHQTVVLLRSHGAVRTS